jgi:hypothetical protein
VADCTVSSRPYVSLMDFFNVETPEGARLNIHSQEYRRRCGMIPGSLCQQSSMYEDLSERTLCYVLPSALIRAEAVSKTYRNHEELI